MSITYHHDLNQGSDEWYEKRLGVLTASTMKQLFTKALKPSSGATPETLMYRLMAERINGWALDGFSGWDMERGHYEEELALGVYCSKREPVTLCGFVENNNLGFNLGFSPDGLVGDDGFVEVKSTKHEFQLRMIFASMIDGSEMPDEHKLQVQTGFLVTGRQWCDFISYSNGMPMAIVRVYPDPAIQTLIIQAATKFEAEMTRKMAQFKIALTRTDSLIPTERSDYTRDEMVV